MLTFTNPNRISTPAAPPKPEKLEIPVDLKRLATAVRDDRYAMMEFRKKRNYAVRQMAGREYGSNAAQQEQPMNLLALYVEIMTGFLCANNPRLMMSTRDSKQDRAVEIMQDWTNAEIVRMNAAAIFRRAIVDGLFWEGIVRVALADADDAEASGWGLKAGQPFMETIDPNDHVCDQMATLYERCAYKGHFYRIPVAVANEIHRTAKQEKFQESDRTDLNYGGDEKIEALGRPSGYREEIEPHTTIWEIWSPKHKQIWLLRDSGGIPDESKEPIAVKRWIGPACGPYHRFTTMDVPGNLNGKGKIGDLMTLSENLNSAWRKLLRQTRDYKKVIPYRGSGDAKRMKNAVDGEMFECENPEALQELEVGGAGNAVWTMAQAMQQGFDFIAGNMALLAGRAAQSDTATQDKILNANATAGVANVQDRVHTFIESCFRSYSWFCWHHPTKVMGSQWKPPSFPNGPSVPRWLGPWNSEDPRHDAKRTGPLPDLRLDVYSLTRQTPQSRLQFMTMVLTQLYAPFAQQAQQAGVAVDWNELFAMLSEFGAEPRLQKIFTYAEPPPMEPGAQGQEPGKPAVTERNYNYGPGQNNAEKAAEANGGFSKIEPGAMNPNSGV